MIAVCVITSFVTAKLTVDGFAVDGIASLDAVGGLLCIEAEYTIVQRFANVCSGPTPTRRATAAACFTSAGGVLRFSDRCACSQQSLLRRSPPTSTGSTLCSRAPSSASREY